MPRDRFSNPALGHNVCMEKKQTPEQDDQQLYGHEMRLIGTHGVEHPGPDQGQFPTSSDQPFQRDQASERESEDVRRKPTDRQRVRPTSANDEGRA